MVKSSHGWRSQSLLLFNLFIIDHKLVFKYMHIAVCNGSIFNN